MRTSARTLKITEQTENKRVVIHIDGHRCSVPWGCYETIKKLAGSKDWTPDTKLDANPGNISRYVYRWQMEWGIPQLGGNRKLRGVCLFENNRNHAWRLVQTLEAIQWECEFGRVPV